MRHRDTDQGESSHYGTAEGEQPHVPITLSGPQAALGARDLVSPHVVFTFISTHPSIRSSRHIYTNRTHWQIDSVCVCVCVCARARACVVSTHGSLHRHGAFSRFRSPITRAVISGKAPASARCSSV